LIAVVCVWMKILEVKIELDAKKDPINEPYNVGDDYNSDTDEDSKLGYKTFLSIEMEMTLPYIHGVPGTSKRISNRYFCLVTHNTHERIVIGFYTDKNKQKVLGKTWANCSSQFMLTKLATHIFSLFDSSIYLLLYKPRAIKIIVHIPYALYLDTILRVPFYTSHSLGFIHFSFLIYTHSILFNYTFFLKSHENTNLKPYSEGVCIIVQVIHMFQKNMNMYFGAGTDS
ncbi:hypothetical protein ACJX0J_030290, partial [Zea mays]